MTTPKSTKETVSNRDNLTKIFENFNDAAIRIALDDSDQENWEKHYAGIVSQSVDAVLDVLHLERES